MSVVRATLILILVSHFFLAADTRRIGVILLNLLQAVVQGYPTPAVRHRSLQCRLRAHAHAHGMRQAGGPSPRWQADRTVL
jgi:hypothetical protein